MASTWSNLGLRLMTTGENANAWGDQTNYNWNRMEDASDGYATLAVTGNHTLTFTTEPTSYADENGRNKVIVFTGSAGGTRTITFPDIEKTYYLLNDSDSTLTLTSGTGATTASLAAGKDMAIYVDGSDEVHNALANLAATTVTTSGAVTLGAQGTTGITLAGIPFFYGDTGSIYTHDVSGTDSTAQYNTAYGLTALDAVTTADANTVIGYGAAGALTSGGESVYVGYLAAGSGVTTGGSNVGVGYEASKDITAAERTVAIGVRALQNITEGTGSIGIGGNAGETITTGTNNICIGDQAGATFDAEDDNIFIGDNAGNGSINGAETNVAVGNLSLIHISEPTRPY